jgi:hypothetical protein
MRTPHQRANSRRVPAPQRTRRLTQGTSGWTGEARTCPLPARGARFVPPRRHPSLRAKKYEAAHALWPARVHGGGRFDVPLQAIPLPASRAFPLCHPNRVTLADSCQGTNYSGSELKVEMAMFTPPEGISVHKHANDNVVHLYRFREGGSLPTPPEKVD